jgi:periplasmic divalent cation tolerance protein
VTRAEDVCEVVITAPDEAWSVEFTRFLVEQGLAAAGHHQPIRSLYTWRGAVYDRTETRIALHTREALVPAIIEETNRHHPYEVPCVVALPFIAADPTYADWIRESTRDTA